ncbi:hypothetical protein Ahy_A04g020021 [Arachis hypogaea]|uniref:CCHC-type domain-containing protein n=1 Tax=Arachis hypogaea TaxID=3818 RepID=A0A445DH27_ARAHY|nr:hypothetical protein Ahy_A04g020021 [Arachis hypogaea]
MVHLIKRRPLTVRIKKEIKMNRKNKMPRRSYRDGLGKLNPQEIVEMILEDYIPEDLNMEAMIEDQAPFNLNPMLKVSFEEYDKFIDSNDYAYALFEGMWMIVDHYMLIRISNLLVELYNKFFLWKVSKALGTMLKVDKLASIHSHRKFMRICVKIDLRKKLVPTFSALGKEFNIVYEDLHQICFNCGRYGHRMENCSEKMTRITNNTALGVVDGESLGSWEDNNGQENNQRFQK